MLLDCLAGETMCLYIFVEILTLEAVSRVYLGDIKGVSLAIEYEREYERKVIFCWCDYVMRNNHYLGVLYRYGLCLRVALKKHVLLPGDMGKG